jgi:roadblock/LC7 domain-containing protein
MTRLDDLLKIDGVVAAGEMTPDGTRVAAYQARIKMTPEMAAMASQFCGTLTMTYDTLATAFSQLTGTPWTPQKAWTYSGGDLTVAVAGRYWLFIQTDKADFARLFQTLLAPPTGLRGLATGLQSNVALTGGVK